MQCCEVLSPQEARLQEEQLGQGSKYEKGRERVFRILRSFHGERPKIDVERAKYFTESMKQTEGQLLMLRWAKALKHIAENITVHVDADQLLVGRSGQQGRYGILYPELDGDVLDLAVEQLSERTQSPADISVEDAQLVIEETAPYGKGKTVHVGSHPRPSASRTPSWGWAYPTACWCSASPATEFNCSPGSMIRRH